MKISDSDDLLASAKAALLLLKPNAWAYGELTPVGEVVVRLNAAIAAHEPRAAAIAELIAADLEVDAAQAAIRENHKPGDVVPMDDPMVIHIQAAETRRKAALEMVTK